MPYRRQAFLQIDSETAIRGTIRIRSVRGVAPDVGYFRAVYREVAAARSPRTLERLAPCGRGHHAGPLIVLRGHSEVPRRPEELERFVEDLRWAIPGAGPGVIFGGCPSPLAGWDASPAQGLFLSPRDSLAQQAAAYRWLAADPIPLVRPIPATGEPDDVDVPPADLRAAVAVFWYSASSSQ
jgi:hypothetical protein